MELHEFHILHWQPCPEHHTPAVSGTSMRRCSGEIRATVATCRQNHLLSRKPVDRAIIEVPRHDPATGPFFVHDQVSRKILDKKFDLMLYRLLVERMQHGMAGAIGRGTGPLCNAFAVIRSHATEWPLINSPVLSPAER